MTIRFANEADAAALALLHARTFPQAWSAGAVGGLLRDPACLCVLADEAPAGAVGFVIARIAADEAEILTIAVAGEARRHGIATALMQTVESALKLRGARRLFLEVGLGNEAAQGLYAKRGFAPVGRRQAYYAAAAGEAGDALLLARDLS